MAKHRRTPTSEPARQVTGGRAGESYWSVDGCGWSSIRPALPAHLVDLLAPPVVVGVARVPATSRPHRAAVQGALVDGGHH